MGNNVTRWAWIAALALGSTAVRAQTRAGSGAAAEPGSASAGTERSAASGRHEKRTVLHFDDDSIRGDLTRPDGELVQAPKRVSHGSLVRLRKSFVDRSLAGVVRGE